jgi:hypothetical protein
MTDKRNFAGLAQGPAKRKRIIIMRRLSGPLLMATGLLNLLYVLVFHSRQLIAIAQDDFFNAVELDPAQLGRETAFWHLTFGVMVLILGGLVYWAQAHTGTLPAFLGWSLLALGLFGAILVPVSGFWVLLPQAVLMLVVARRRRTGTAAGEAGLVAPTGSGGGSPS